MKRFLALCMAVFMLISATACGKTEDETADGNGDYIPDFSDHTDPAEGNYWTKLINLSQLGDGQKHLVFKCEPSDWRPGPFEGVEKGSTWGYDVRAMDLSDVDLSFIDSINDLSFNSLTIWPEELPDGFDPEAILELNKNPGLHVRDLHEQGVTGKGVGIAIIDQGLFTGHEEYSDNLKSYELIHCADQDESCMHGSGVSSIAVGKTVGVAPDADLYYIASTYAHPSDNPEGFEIDASIIADCILRICDMNKYLPDENRIRVISISRGYGKEDLGYEELQEAIKKADEQGIFVLTTTPEKYYEGFDLMGLSKDYTGDPDDIGSYAPAAWLKNSLGNLSVNWQNRIFVPMGSRTYASWLGSGEYEINYEGGMSWAVPWCAGFYALCCQVDPDITPSEFIELVKNTADIVDISEENTSISLNIKIINPVAAIDELRK